ncbi:protein-disulfide reductase DsbD domain-containing protein [Ferruginibacter sp. SUN106]|uniref:protein-disulfide reductase DsbD domain-containing protein n=1 Tax=Ferruginibacter sp. SUN106 TaxID=2978348 RepID=UPI003D35C68D
MKKIIVAIGLMIFTIGAVNAQKVAWSYTAKKLAGDKYELHITAQPPTGWHIYSQNTPDGGPVPTTFKFNKNPLATIAGKVKENGKLVSYYDKSFKVNVKYFEGKVEFTQIVSVKAKIKTNITGEIESMICNDRTCMPPSTETFAIPIQ